MMIMISSVSAHTLSTQNHSSGATLSGVSRADAELCGYSEECGFVRFTYVMLGSAIAACGCIFNVILIFALKRKTKPDVPPTLFPVVLALLDALICFFYIFLFGVDAAAIYLHHAVRLF
ncbi:unnamed protein product [Gongylonema pulchrum]|uniref:G_PROTEIN_RECEP_F1_2 domain-containing protein n=1 Tax=Gongylonema pulchrum TaxID=637853 RepID=A0A183ENL9_9BILA|nr:unnamed protein product [Gongylonema pulchrum]